MMPSIHSSNSLILSFLAILVTTTVTGPSLSICLGCIKFIIHIATNNRRLFCKLDLLRIIARYVENVKRKLVRDVGHKWNFSFNQNILRGRMLFRRWWGIMLLPLFI